MAIFEPVPNPELRDEPDARGEANEGPASIPFMTARWVDLSYHFLDHVSRRIMNEIEDISRVVYDISSKPPGTIEWE